MASHQETVDHICEQLGGAGSVSSRKMFGEYGVYCDEKFIGVICDNTLFLKVTEQARQAEPQITLAPAYEGAKPGFMIPADMLEDAPRLAAFARLVHDSLPARKK